MPIRGRCPSPRRVIRHICTWVRVAIIVLRNAMAGILWVDEGMRFDTHRLHGVTLTLDDERARPVSSTQPRVHARAAPFEESQRWLAIVFRFHHPAPRFRFFGCRAGLVLAL